MQPEIKIHWGSLDAYIFQLTYGFGVVLLTALLADERECYLWALGKPVESLANVSNQVQTVGHVSLVILQTSQTWTGINFSTTPCPHSPLIYACAFDDMVLTCKPLVKYNADIIINFVQSVRWYDSRKIY